MMIKGSNASRMGLVVEGLIDLLTDTSQQKERFDDLLSDANFGRSTGANLFNYITFRAGGATMTALLISFILGPWMINTLRNRQSRGQPIRADGPQSHLTTKVGTPTMGGLLILLASIGSTLLWGNLQNIFLWIALLTTLSFGLIGFADDYSNCAAIPAMACRGASSLCWNR